MKIIILEVNILKLSNLVGDYTTEYGEFCFGSEHSYGAGAELCYINYGDGLGYGDGAGVSLGQVNKI